MRKGEVGEQRESLASARIEYAFARRMVDACLSTSKLNFQLSLQFLNSAGHVYRCCDVMDKKSV